MKGADLDERRPLARSSVQAAGEQSRSSLDKAQKKRKSSQLSARDANPLDIFGSRAKASKTNSTGDYQQQQSAGSSRMSKLRKGSIAQVSISNVIRLSHKLSIKKRHSNLSSNRYGQEQRSQQAKRTGQQATGKVDPQDPLQVGQQILNAYLARQQQRELEEQELRRRKELEAKAAKPERQDSEGQLTSCETLAGQSGVVGQQQMQQLGG